MLNAHSLRHVAFLGGLLALGVTQFSWGQVSGQDKIKERQIAAIKRALRPQGLEETSWYVLLLREVTRMKNFQNQLIEKTNVKFVKVQGQAAAAEELYNFLKAPKNSLRTFAYRSFANTDQGKKQADEVYSKQITLGMLQGGRLQ